MKKTPMTLDVPRAVTAAAVFHLEVTGFEAEAVESASFVLQDRESSFSVPRCLVSRPTAQHRLTRQTRGPASVHIHRRETLKNASLVCSHLKDRDTVKAVLENILALVEPNFIARLKLLKNF